MKILLFSGGLDSTCAAAICEPDSAVTFTYGQVPADGEVAASRKLTSLLGLEHHVVDAPLRWTGTGLLAGRAPSEKSAAPEWWPFRNQLLVTLAAAWAIGSENVELIVGAVAGDGERHVDGTRGFFDGLDDLVAMQEGGIRVRAPFLDLDPVEVVRRSGLGLDVLSWTHSCHRGSVACGDCPGCVKRRQVLDAAFPV